MKIRLVGAELFRADGRTNRYYKANNRFTQFLRTRLKIFSTSHTTHRASITKTNQPVLKNKNQLDATYYFIVLLIGSTCFGHYYGYHQELTTIVLVTK